MRRSLAVISAAVTSLVAVSFLVPLLVLVGDQVRDRALAAAFGSAATTASLVALDPTPQSVRRAVANPPAPGSGPTTVHLPAPGGGIPRIGTTVGRGRVAVDEVLRVIGSGQAATAAFEGGTAVLQPVFGSSGLVAVVEVDVPDRVLDAGVLRARTVLIGFAVVLVLGSLLLADRLADRVVRAAQRLQAAAVRLGAGDLDVRVQPEGPPELRDAGEAFNLMAEQVGHLVLAERELVADLSHRLRTPLAGLLLSGRSLGPGPEGDQVRALTGRLQEEVDAVIAEARRRPGSVQRPRCDAVAVLRDRLDFWGALAEDQGRPWSLILPGPSGRVAPEPVAVSESDLKSVVDALVGNVFVHTPEGCRLQVELRRVRAGVALVVEDAGPGIGQPEHAVRRGSSGAGSSGLGLDIVTRVAESAGSRLRIGRGPLGGARLEVELPRPPDGVPASPAAGSGRTAGSGQTGGMRSRGPGSLG